MTRPQYGRGPLDVDLIVPVLAVAGDTPEVHEILAREAKAVIGFYGSTPNIASNSMIWAMTICVLNCRNGCGPRGATESLNRSAMKSLD